MTDETPITSRVFGGMLIVALGVVWLFDNLGMMDASQVVQWWPVAAIVWGLMCLAGLGRRRSAIGGSIWLHVGLVGLLDTLGWINPISIFDLWPIALIAVGAMILLRDKNLIFKMNLGVGDGEGGASGTGTGAARRSVMDKVAGEVHYDAAGPRLVANAMLGSSRHNVTSTSFAGGEITTILGATVVDLRNAQIANGRAEIEVFVALGGSEIIVPAGWRVASEMTAILGEYQDQTVQSAEPTAPLLVLKGAVVMGGVEVMNGRRDDTRYGASA